MGRGLNVPPQYQLLLIKFQIQKATIETDDSLLYLRFLKMKPINLE